MRRKKTIRTVSIVVCFVLFWAFAVGATTNLAARHAQGRLSTLQQQVTDYLAQTMRDQKQSYTNAYQFFASSAAVKPALDEDLLKLYIDRYDSEFIAVDRLGDILNNPSNSVQALGVQFVNSVVNSGYSSAYLSEWDGQKNYLAFGFDIGAPEKVILVRLIPIGDLAADLRDAFRDDVSSIAIFNQWGSKIYVDRSTPGTDSVDILYDHALAAATYKEMIVPGSFLTGGDSYFFVAPKGNLHLLLGFSVTETQLSAAMYAIRITYLVLIALTLVLLVFYFTLYQQIKRRSKENNASRDSLSGLMMLSEMESNLQQFFKRNTPRSFCFVQMDIVSFRRFNMMFGFTSGDLLLKTVGKCIGEHYLCGARLNSDIFAFIAPVHEGFIEEMESLFHKAASEELGELYTQMTNFKFGLFPLLQEHFSFRDAIDGSMIALRNAKSDVKRSCVIYDNEMLKADKINKRIAMSMLTALENKEFLMYVQPKFSADGARCGGGEALVRWQSDQLGFMMPYQFIPLFERNGFIAELDFYMLDKVMQFLQMCKEKGNKILPISVNQSRITIMLPNYLSRLREIVEKYDVPLHHVEIEITENVFTESYETISMLIYEIRGMGFSISMDDFGKGYSSLSALRELPVDILKIDKEFLNESDVSTAGRKIIHNILNLARDLGIGTVCEGVETGTQLEFLNRAGCDLLQGYYLSRPMSEKDYYDKFVP